MRYAYLRLLWGRWGIAQRVRRPSPSELQQLILKSPLSLH